MSLYPSCGLLLLWFHSINSNPSFAKNKHFIENSDLESVVSDYIKSRGYLPDDKDLQVPLLSPNTGSDVTYVLSKLSDEDLIKLLNEQPKKTNYDLNDILKISKFVRNDKQKHNINKIKLSSSSGEEKENQNVHRFQTISNQDELYSAHFRLENKQVDPYKTKSEDLNYATLQKLNNMLYSRPNQIENSVSDEKKGLIFDVLVAQLKTLCCNGKINTKIGTSNLQYDDSAPAYKSRPVKFNKEIVNKSLKEYLFLIINDEMRSNGSDELISVDPDSLEKNSSVLLLGPLTTPLTDNQLKLVMNRIFNELSKSEYEPLLQQLSDGTLSSNNVQVMKSLFTGPETRRYIKPHRCNHQSKLAKTYGGTKWIICTGYLNLNTPSIYD